MTDAPAPILDVTAVAAMLDCAPDTVRELARTGALPGLRIGRDWVFPAGALLRGLEALAEAQAQQRRQPARPLATARGGQAGGRKAPPMLPMLRGVAR